MKIRHYLRYPVDITRAKRKLSDRDESDEVYSGRPVVLDLYTTDLLLDCGRHFSAIAHLGAANGSPVIVRCSRLVLAAIAHKPFGSQMLEMSNVGWIDESKSLPENALVLTDVSDSPSNRPGTGRTPVILLIGKDIVDQYPVMPYPMHPGVRKHAGRIQIEACRGINDRRGIFFSGSQRAKYGRDVLRNGFGVLNRLEILKHIRTAFPERVAESRDTAKHPMPIILPAPEGAKATAPISIDRWLPALAKHQFFLCCPGIAQPMCHNIIEAMSVGVIPIIEYPERFSPPLVDGVTAICFRGTEGLADAIARIDRMKPAEIRRLSDNVAAHYDRYLDGVTFLGQLIDQSENNSPACISLPFHDENLTAMQTQREAKTNAA